MSAAVTRSHLADGRVVGWFGASDVVIDAEIAAAVPPPALVALYGEGDFWARWTAAECGAKAFDVPIVLWLREHGLTAGPLTVETRILDGVVVSSARRPSPA
jgi:hypothetical protein